MNNSANPNYPRVPPRLTPLYINQPLYFITLCTYKRKAILDREDIHEIFREFGRQSLPKAAVGRYVIMPDHIHLFLRGDPTFSLSSWVGRLKQKISMCVTSQGMELPIWQKGFFDHVLRSDESYSEKWAYVRFNPVRAGLVTEAEHWPYQGECVRIDRT